MHKTNSSSVVFEKKWYNRYRIEIWILHNCLQSKLYEYQRVVLIKTKMFETR